MRRSLLLPAVFVLFTVSGFAGLIYESIWSHYLKLFLGHAAYAQSLVLAIFMGGMALGAWAASRLSARWRDLLLAYALIEAPRPKSKFIHVHPGAEVLGKVYEAELYIHSGMPEFAQAARTQEVKGAKRRRL